MTVSPPEHTQSMLAEASYDQFSITLGPWDMLVVVSDGIIEACNREGGFWAAEEVDRVLIRRRTAELTDLPRLLVEAVDPFSDGAEQ